MVREANENDLQKIQELYLYLHEECASVCICGKCRYLFRLQECGI